MGDGGTPEQCPRANKQKRSDVDREELVPCMVLLCKLAAVRRVQDSFYSRAFRACKLRFCALCCTRARLCGSKLFAANASPLKHPLKSSVHHLWSSIVVDHDSICLAVSPWIKSWGIDVRYVKPKQNNTDPAVLVFVVFERQRWITEQPCNIHRDHVCCSRWIHWPCLQKMSIVWIPFTTLVLPSRHLFHHPPVQKARFWKTF